MSDLVQELAVLIDMRAHNPAYPHRNTMPASIAAAEAIVARYTLTRQEN